MRCVSRGLHANKPPQRSAFTPDRSTASQSTFAPYPHPPALSLALLVADGGEGTATRDGEPDADSIAQTPATEEEKPVASADAEDEVCSRTDATTAGFSHLERDIYSCSPIEQRPVLCAVSLTLRAPSSKIPLNSSQHPRALHSPSPRAALRWQQRRRRA